MNRGSRLLIMLGILAATGLSLWWIESRQQPVERYSEWIREYSLGTGLDPDLVEAVVFAESSRRSGVVSSKGAVGLMQLMPSTAAEVGARLGLAGVDSDMLKDPQLNLRLGIEYLSWLRQRYDSLELTLAAYNAGPGRVATWLRENPELSTQHLLDEVAYDETRTFVARVLRRYAQRMEKSGRQAASTSEETVP